MFTAVIEYISVPENALWLALAIPFVGSFFVLMTGRFQNLREAMTLITAIALFFVITRLYLAVDAGLTPDLVLVEMIPGLTIRLTLEPLGMIFAGIASFLWIITTIYAVGYMRGHHEKNQTRFFFFFAIAIFSAMGVALAGNMLTLFVFYEILSVSTFPLVTHHGTDDAKKAGRVYLGILLSTSIGFLLFAMVWTYDIAGSLDFVKGGLLADGKVTGTFAGVLLALYAFGIGKAALMPFHRWLPAAMVAPTPVSALLHAVAVVKAGVFSVVKVVVYIFGIDTLADLPSAEWLAYVAAFTIIVASIIAFRQDNLKRRLAYSTVSQLAYVVIAAAILTPISVTGAALHIAAHAFGKITLFFAAGAILVTAHKTEISQLDGIGRRMPLTMIAFAIGALSMIGMPPTAGFVSKWFIIEGAMAADHYEALAVIIGSTLLNTGYFIPIVYAAFFKPEKPMEAHADGHHGDHSHHGDPPHDGDHQNDDDDHHGDHHGDHDHGEAAFPMAFALAVTATMTLVTFFWHEIPLGLAQALVGHG